MRLIPTDDEYRVFVALNDCTRAREANGIAAPGQNAADEDLERYLEDIIYETGMAHGPWISGFTENHLLDQLRQREYLGFDIRDMERSILAGEPPNVLEVVTVRFDPQATGRLLAACVECDQPDLQQHLGVSFYSWGEDYASDFDKVLQPPAHDYFGRGGRIALLDSLVFRTLATESMRSLIETSRISGNSLADDPDMVMAAEALDRVGVYSAYLIGDTEEFSSQSVFSLLGISEEEAGKVREALGLGRPEDAPIMHRYEALGAGVKRDEEGFATVLVFVYENEDLAVRSARVFEERLAAGNDFISGRPWTEYFPQREVWNDGRALITRLSIEKPLIGSWIWQTIVHTRDPLLAWEAE